jgi:glycosyltransferase domain-containing protein
MPLKGRHLFTLRFLWYANRVGLPYRFLLADGQVHATLSRMLENSRELFPKLDLTYVSYPDDSSFSRYYSKMLDAVGRVCTPYVVYVDNDDFPVASGIDRSVAFLESNREYVCCGGGLAGFSVYAGLNDPHQGLLGKLNHLSYRYTSFDRSEDFSSPSVTERVRKGARNWWSFYAVFRKEALETIYREIAEIDFSDLQLCELFCAMRTLTLGKARSDGSAIGYIRQYGTSQRGAFKKDWVHHLLRSRFTSDFDLMIGRISELGGTADGVESTVFAEELRAICEDWLRSFLRDNYGSVQTLKQLLRDRAPVVVNWLKNRRRYSVSFERRAFYDRLLQDGASENYIAQFKQEFAHIEDTFAGQNFADFVRPYKAAFR